MPTVNSTTKPKPARKHPTSVGARARAHRWRERPGGLSVPGPGTYDVTSKPPGGLFGRFPEGSGKSDIEWEIYRSKQLPGPADYHVPDSLSTTGGRFSMAKPKNEIDQVIYRVKDLPGPGRYNLPDSSQQIGGGRFNMSKAKTDIEWTIYHAAQKPGAGEYRVPDSFGAGGGVNFACKPPRPNYQTALPDAVLYSHNTIQVSPHTSCRTDPSIGRQIISSQRTEPAYSFGGGKTFDMQEHNIKRSLGFAKRAKAGRARRKKAQGGKTRTKKEQADEMFRKFFGYDPADKSKRGRHGMAAKTKKMPRPMTTPGPGHYSLPPTMGASKTQVNSSAFSFPTD